MMSKPKAPPPPANTPYQASYVTDGATAEGKKKRRVSSLPAPVTGSSAINAGRPSLLGGS
ncbi:MAG: hypothetical protein CL484_03050 [Acidobacteria bacterium]|nr:hypothetical protein [Acidobacteriota bacterium]